MERKEKREREVRSGETWMFKALKTASSSWASISPDREGGKDDKESKRRKGEGNELIRERHRPRGGRGEGRQRKGEKEKRRKGEKEKRRKGKDNKKKRKEKKR